MNKLITLTLITAGFMFANNGQYSTIVEENSTLVKAQYSWAEDQSKQDDDKKLERRRSGKGNRKRRRGGSGLR